MRPENPLSILIAVFLLIREMTDSQIIPSIEGNSLQRLHVDSPESERMPSKDSRKSLLVILGGEIRDNFLKESPDYVKVFYPNGQECRRRVLLRWSKSKTNDQRKVTAISDEEHKRKKNKPKVDKGKETGHNILLRQPLLHASAVRVSDGILLCGGLYPNLEFNYHCYFWMERRKDVLHNRPGFKVIKNALPNSTASTPNGIIYMKTDPSDKEANWNRIFLLLPYSKAESKFYVGTWIPERQVVVWCEASLPEDTFIFTDDLSLPSCVFAYDRFFYVIGGDRSGGRRDKIRKYDYYKDEWNTVGEVPGETRIFASCAAFHGSILISGGKSTINGHILSDMHHKNFMTRKWDSPLRLSHMRRPLHQHTLAVLGDGINQRILAAYGITEGGKSNPRVERYKHKYDGGWRKGSRLEVSVFYHTAVVIPQEFLPYCPVQSSSKKATINNLLLLIIILLFLKHK